MKSHHLIKSLLCLICLIHQTAFADTSTVNTELPADYDWLFQQTEKEVQNTFEDSALDYKIEMTGISQGRNINDNSRRNPQNAVHDLNEGQLSCELDLTASDKFFEESDLRWFAKTYSLLSSDEKDDEATRTNRFDELFVDLDREEWFVSFGKRRINWGHARAFNPVNVVVPLRDPLEPKQETEGRQMAWFDFTRGSGSIDLIWARDFSPPWDSDPNRWGTRLGWTGERSDFSLYYFDGEKYENGNAYEQMFGFSFSANVWDSFTLYSEVARFSENNLTYYDTNGNERYKDENYWQAAGGIFISPDANSVLSFFRGEAFLTLELYYNGAAYSENERMNYFDALDTDLVKGNNSVADNFLPNAMNEGYFLISYSNSFKEQYQIQLDCLLAKDESFSTKILGKYNATNSYSVEASWIRNHGGDDSEYGNALFEDIFEILLIIAL